MNYWHILLPCLWAWAISGMESGPNLSMSGQFFVAERSIKRLTRQLNSLSSPEQKLNCLTTILHHHLTKAEILQEKGHPAFMMEMLTITKLNEYLGNSYVNPYVQKRINNLEEYYKAQIPSFKIEKSPFSNKQAIQKIESLKNWSEQFKKTQKLAEQATKYKKVAQSFFQSGNMQKSREYFIQAIHCLIAQARMELTNESSQLAIYTLFKARILLTYIKDGDTKDLYLCCIKALNRNLPVIKIQESLNSQSTSNARLGESSS